MAIMLLIGLGVFVAAALLEALSGLSYAKVALAGMVLAVALWVVAAINIYRGPDNPDLGEDGWTMAVGILLGIYVGVWLLGAAAGALVRRSGSASDPGSPKHST